MGSRYDPQDHIQPLAVAPRAEGILDQREITIQSYQTTVPFDFAALDAGLDRAWLTPQIRFGVFARIPSTGRQALNVVLGLQDELTIRAYDYDNRRPLWYSWRDAIVDTVNLHYFRDEDGLLRFTTTGGGRRITDDRLHDFNSAFLEIPKQAVGKRQFDLDKLRELCFKRFADSLYMIRFADPSAQEYRSIDHALFQSRQYIDPKAERLQEISTDKKVKIESFDSDIAVQTEELAVAIQVRFFIRGTSGSLRLRFPKVFYKSQLKTAEDQAIVFYRLANATVSAILDADYYTHQPHTLDELSADLGMFPDMVDLAPFREVLVRAEARTTFLSSIDLGEHWPKWGPHLQAIDELLASEVIVADVQTILDDLVCRDPSKATRLLAVCQDDARKYRVGGLVARALASQLQAVPAELRAQVEEAILSWAIDREQESWDIDVATGEFHMLNLKWRIDDFAFDVFPIILWKLVGVLHARLLAATGDVGALLHQFHWCMVAARNLPPHHSRSRAALRLVAGGRVPPSVAAAAGVLKEPVADFRALDEAMLAQFGLPLWPFLTASRQEGTVKLGNEGLGVALAIQGPWADNAPADAKPSSAFDLGPGEAVALPLADNLPEVVVRFEKLGQTYQLRVPIAGVASSAAAADPIRRLPTIINGKRLTDLKTYRKHIDPEGIVVGSSWALLQVFEQIHHANLRDDLPAVLLLGEPGVGKTHIAQLLHKSSSRASQVFKVVNAGHGGGDINIQRGEWIGYGQGHGIQGIDRKGRPGHLLTVNGGTLFIDEFASLAHDLQVIFLSVLEKCGIEKVGGESCTPDVRCIFATNADVDQEVARKALRRDLLDRIPVRISIPPLRERRGDILLLAKYFAADQGITDRCLIALLQYQWPGNIRELQNKVVAAKARRESEGDKSKDIGHFDLPADIVATVMKWDDDRCRRELWILADGIARAEGFGPGTGLQRRAAEIRGVSAAQASKVYQSLGPTLGASA